MKKIILLLVFIISGIYGNTQTEYSDQYLGWIRMIKANDPVKPAKYDHRQFSATQLSTCNLFISWLQASYMPKGGLGEGRRFANEKLSPYNQYTRSLHNYYGAFLPTYVFLKKKAGGGWTPENNLGLFLRMTANGLVGDHVDVISSTEQYYFYIPDVRSNDEYARSNQQFMGFNTHPVFSRYIHYYQPKSIRFLSQYNVILSKNNERPWVQITKGEFLEQLEKSINRTHADNLKKINEDYNEKRKQSFLENESALYKKRLEALAGQKEKYRNRLNEKATIYTEQPSVHLENTPDLFEGNGGVNQKIPVYKFDPAWTAKTSTDRPQWITISWGGGEMNDETFKNLHASMLNNVDIDYIYNYFFDPEKIKGKPYLPLRPPVRKEEPAAKTESANAIKQKAVPGTILFDDFSNTLPGKTPLNWKSGNNYFGEPAKVELQSENGDPWAVIKGQQLELKEKINLPANFTFTCDIAVPKGYTWGVKRLVIRFGSDKASFLVSMRPGFDGNPGFLYAGPDDFGSTILQTGSTARASEIPIPGFSNNMPINKFQLQVRKKGQSLELWVNQKQVFSNTNAFTEQSTIIRGIGFAHLRSDSEFEKYFIDNIKILNE